MNAANAQYPVKTAALAAYLPHRPPMVWVDEVVSTDEENGLCRIVFDPKASYCDEHGVVRRTSFLEWMAQGYGYAMASKAFMGTTPMEQIPKNTFLAQMRNVSFFDEPAFCQEFFVETKVVKILGPISLVHARVRSPEGVVFATADLKLFAQ